MNFKHEIIKRIDYEGLTKQQMEDVISVPPDANLGDFSLPCFTFAKILRKKPQDIATEIKYSIIFDGLIEKVEVVDGYLNFFLSKREITEYVVLNLVKEGLSNKEDNDKTVCIDYSSVNLAKYMHIGHWATTIIGESIARLYESQGYTVYRLNYIGDYGLPFGKMVYEYLKNGNKKVVQKKGIDELQRLYVEFCKNETEETLAAAREISKKIEDRERDVYPIYTWFIDISKKEAKRLLDKVGITFDSWKGESAYNDKMEPIIEEIKDSGLSKISEGALIIDLNEYNLGVSVIQRKDGASLYVTRDLAALEDRFDTYEFDEMIYVTAVQQSNHFEKLFKICELLKKPYAGKLYHAYYGMFSTPEGKIASRNGKQALFEDLLNLAEENVSKAFTNKNFSEDEKLEVGRKIAKSAVAFTVLKVDRVKDKVFEADKATSFDGETAPYVQYTYARCYSILNKAEDVISHDEYADFDALNFETIFPMVKIMNNIEQTIESAFKKKEPSVLIRDMLELCRHFNKFYGEAKVIDEKNPSKSKALLSIVESVKNVLEYTMPLVCIDVIESM